MTTRTRVLQLKLLAARITTALYLGQCEARRRGITLRMLLREWALAPP